MSMTTFDRKAQRAKRHRRIRKQMTGTAQRPRLAIYRSLTNIYAQVIDDSKGVTLVAASTMEKEVQELIKDVSKKAAAKIVGKAIAERATKAGIQKVVFDRGGYVYTGRVAELAAGAREAGLEF
jgi:large subunit ribosomal protein L18